MKKIIIAALCFALAACSRPSAEEDSAPAKPYTPITLTKAEMGINGGVTAFGFDVYKALYKGDQMCVSPLSLSLAMSMTAYGACGQTEQQMLATMGFGAYTKEEMCGYYSKMMAALPVADNKTKVEIANAIWTNKLYPVKASFISGAHNYFASEATTADFSAPSVVGDINKWCATHTHDKIVKMVDHLDASMAMVLLNALYFNGKWADEFERVKRGSFTDISGRKVSKQMMTKERSSLKYATDAGYEMVSLPYGNGAFVMDVILPPTDRPFNEAVASLDAKQYRSLTAASKSERVLVQMPEFKFEDKYELKDALVALGMPLAFSDFADFSDMCEMPLKIGQVVQKTYIDVNQKGTEAAAVTMVGMMGATATPQEPRLIDFIADRPFLFAIREQSTYALLFLGQVVK